MPFMHIFMRRVVAMSKKFLKKDRTAFEMFPYYDPLTYAAGYEYARRYDFKPCRNAVLDTRLIYALILLIVITLQFGRNPDYSRKSSDCRCRKCCCCFEEEYDLNSEYRNAPYNNQLIDNSVLFIIVIFLLIFCGGCNFSSQCEC